MPLCTICKARQADKKNEVVPDPTPPTGPPTKKGRGRPRSVENFKDAKKKYNSTYYQRKKERRGAICVLDNIPVEAT
jgi:hypothetical protein